MASQQMRDAGGRRHATATATILWTIGIVFAIVWGLAWALVALILVFLAPVLVIFPLLLSGVPLAILIALWVWQTTPEPARRS